MYMYKKLTS